MSLTTRIRDGSLHPALLPRRLHLRDLSYAGFLASGLVIALALALNWLPSDSWIYLGLAELFRLPMLFVYFGGALLGTAFGLVAWREWRPLVLGVLSAAVAFLPWLVRARPQISDLVAGSFLVLYVLLALGLPTWWFLVDRRRLLRRYPPRVEGSWIE